MDRSAPEGRPTRPVAFVVVHDVAASWATYEACGLGFGLAVPGLLVHAAGPTDEGVRTVDFWLSDAAYERERNRRDHWPAGLAAPPVVRTLHVHSWRSREPAPPAARTEAQM